MGTTYYFRKVGRRWPAEKWPAEKKVSTFYSPTVVSLDFSPATPLGTVHGVIKYKSFERTFWLSTLPPEHVLLLSEEAPF